MDMWQRIIWICTVLWRYRYTIVIPMLMLPIGGVLIGSQMPKQYSTHTSMLIQETAKMNPFLEDFSVSTLLEERIGALKTLLHSRHILTTVAEELGSITEASTPAERDWIISELSGKLKLGVVSKDVYRLELKDTDPKSMEQTLTIVSRYFIEELLTPERSSISGSANFLEEQIQKNLTDLSLGEAKLARFKNEHPNELPEYRKAYVARLEQMKQDLAEKMARLAGEKKRLGSLAEQLSATNPIVSGIEEKIIQAQGELASLRSRYTDEHSSVKQLTYQLAQLETERQKVMDANRDIDNLKNLWILANKTQSADPGELTLLMSQLNALQQNQGTVAHLEETTQYLKRDIEELNTKLRDMGSREQELSTIIRDVSVKKDLHNDLLKRYEMAKITGSLSAFESQDRVKIIDKPFTPTRPNNPPLILFVIAGIFGGLALGIGLAVISEAMDSRIRRADQILALAPYITITHIPALQNAN